VIALTEPQDWPFEQPAEGTLRPWYLTATGYLVALFSDPEEARRTQRGLLERKVPREELRLYESEEILRIVSRLQQERSIMAKAVAAWSPTLQPSNAFPKPRPDHGLCPIAWPFAHSLESFSVLSSFIAAQRAPANPASPPRRADA
jgi:hypothetical protein